jgi:hypothetical protein
LDPAAVENRESLGAGCSPDLLAEIAIAAADGGNDRPHDADGIDGRLDHVETGTG